ncbi:hypothetical protein F5884DRAFT_508001 [Xylogone sp. PMI_703]|nr:hypothetical protein F5884DRAFT_508001 [Xylogone sp. PMI_703]
MTQLRKCDSCRARKIKCDEKQPRCGNCSKKLRPCRYAYTGQILFITEMPRTKTSRSRESNNRSSELQVVKSLMPKQVPFSTGMMLAARWVGMIGGQTFSSNGLRIFGACIAHIPSRIGSNPALDAAVRYVLDCHQAHLLGTKETLCRARSSGLRASKGLRLAYQAGDQQDFNLLITVKLHFVAEIFLAVGTFTYVVHLIALSRMLAARGLPDINQEPEWSLCEITIFDEIVEAMHASRDSIFDTPDWLASMETRAAAQKTPFDIASLLVMRNMIRLPRLARLIRLHQRDPSDIFSSLEAIELAQTLLEDDSETYILQVLQRHALIKPTSSSDDAWLAPNSWHFDSIPVFELVMRHYTYQVLLCGLIDKLCETEPLAAMQFDTSGEQMKDVQAAHSIAMCAQYAFSLNPGLPLAALRMLAPQQIAFGAWCRLVRRRALEFHGEQLQQAEQAKSWCLDLIHRICRQWKVVPLSALQMEQATIALAGGPFPEFMGPRGGPEKILARLDRLLESSQQS